MTKKNIETEEKPIIELEKRSIDHLKEEPTYRRLCLRRDVIKLIFDLRCYRAILNNDKEVTDIDNRHLQEFLEQKDCISPRIEAILAETKNGMINVSATDTANDDLYGKLNDLIKKYPQHEQVIKDIDNEIIYLKFCCPNCQPLCIELMDFAAANHTPKSLRDNIFRLTRELLTYTVYDRKAPERKYLTAKSPSIGLYRAYFFRKDALPAEEHNFALNELLKVISTSSYPYPNKFDKLIEEHLNIEGCFVDEDTYKTLLVENNNTCLNTRKALSAIYNTQRTTPIDIHEYIKTTLKGIMESDSYIKNEEIKRLFFTLMYAAPTRDWVQTFTDELVKYPHHEERADFLLAYIRAYYKNPFPLLFEDSYIGSKTELEEKRTDLVMVLRAISEKKQKSRV